MAGSDKNIFDSNKIYNVTEEEIRAMQERAKMRDAMKQEFQKKVSSPYRGVGGYIVSDLRLREVRENVNCENDKLTNRD